MKTIVEIEWDSPNEQAWLCADNISIALHEYCKNTKFKVKTLEKCPNSDFWTIIKNGKPSFKVHVCLNEGFLTRKTQSCDLTDNPTGK